MTSWMTAGLSVAQLKAELSVAGVSQARLGRYLDRESLAEFYVAHKARRTAAMRVAAQASADAAAWQQQQGQQRQPRLSTTDDELYDEEEEGRARVWVPPGGSAPPMVGLDRLFSDVVGELGRKQQQQQQQVENLGHVHHPEGAKTADLRPKNANLTMALEGYEARQRQQQQASQHRNEAQWLSSSAFSHANATAGSSSGGGSGGAGKTLSPPVKLVLLGERNSGINWLMHLVHLNAPEVEIVEPFNRHGLDIVRRGVRDCHCDLVHLRAFVRNASCSVTLGNRSMN